MEKLIITVAGDSRTSYPHNNLCPPQEDIPGVTQQYVDAVKAGAAIAHIHGRRTLEETFQADGKMVSKIHHADWKKLHESIMSKVDPIMQYGVASARIEEKIELMKLIRSTGLAALIATHNPELAKRMNRTVTLREGLLVAA